MPVQSILWPEAGPVPLSVRSKIILHRYCMQPYLLLKPC